MAYEEIPTLFDGTAHYTQLVALAGVQYLLKFDFNSRDDHWYLSIYTPEGEPISGCVCQKLVQQWTPCRLSVDPLKPAGRLLVASELHSEPGLLDLGNGSDLFFITPPDLPVT